MGKDVGLGGGRRGSKKGGGKKECRKRGRKGGRYQHRKREKEEWRVWWRKTTERLLRGKGVGREQGRWTAGVHDVGRRKGRNITKDNER